MKPKLARTFSLMAISLLVLSAGFTGCAGGDSATVRIHFSLPSNEIAYRPTIIDRVLSFFTVGTMLHAGPPPEDEEINIIRVTVSGPDMDTITVDGDPSTGYIELEVPSGHNRKFEIRAGNRVEGEPDNWYYGNETKVSLAGGETKILRPVMVGMVHNIYPSSSNGLNISWSYYGKKPTQVIIQILLSESGHWETLSIKPENLDIAEDDKYCSYNDISSTIDSGYVRIKHMIGDSSGLFSEPVEIQYNP